MLAIISNPKKGVSSLQLACDLDVNQKTALRMQKKIREVINYEKQGQLFACIVECDECYILKARQRKVIRKDNDDN